MKHWISNRELRISSVIMMYIYNNNNVHMFGFKNLTLWTIWNDSYSEVQLLIERSYNMANQLFPVNTVFNMKPIIKSCINARYLFMKLPPSATYLYNSALCLYYPYMPFFRCAMSLFSLRIRVCIFFHALFSATFICVTALFTSMHKYAGGYLIK